MSFVNDTGRRLAHPDWTDEAFASLAKSMDLRRTGAMPECLNVPMIVTPLRRMLRGVYGSNWGAVRALAAEAARVSIEEWRGTLWRFWHYRVLMESPDAAIHRMMYGDDGEDE